MSKRNPAENKDWSKDGLEEYGPVGRGDTPPVLNIQMPNSPDPLDNLDLNAIAEYDADELADALDPEVLAALSPQALAKLGLEEAAAQLKRDQAAADTAGTEDAEDAESAEGAEGARGDDNAAGKLTLDSEGLTLPIQIGAGQAADPNNPIPQTPVTAEDLADLQEVEAELNTRWSEEKIDPTLERMEQLVDILGHPERSFPSVHVAGTNGKTSTVRMIESLCRALGSSTGRTTSPHLQTPTERIAINGEPISPREYVDAWREIQHAVEFVDERSIAGGGPRMSKFEVLTAMAFSVFADRPVDVGIVETGMGGAWDATNVMDGDVAVITPIGYDHMDYLGETLTDIATEKAGIIKSRWDMDDLLAPPDNVVIVAAQEAEAMSVILHRAQEVDASVARAGSEFGVLERRMAVGGQQLTIRGLGGEYTDIFLSLSGAHQADNAAVALAAVEALFGMGSGRMLDIDAVRMGFAQVESPGRLERVRSTPSVFVDATHNPHGAQALATSIEEEFEFRRLIGVVGVLGDKDARGILLALEPILDEVVITQTSSPRALDAYHLADLAREVFGEERVHTVENLPGAVELAIALAEDTELEGEIVSGSGVLITGSVVTAGEARTLFGKEPK